MALFVHIADERDTLKIRRTGLKVPRSSRPANSGTPPPGVFALPVIANYLVSHQWVRELKRRGFKVAVGVYLRIPDEQTVWAGHYNETKQPMSAAEAVAFLRTHETLGYEAIIPRSVAASEIAAIRPLRQNLGWRHFPGAHARGIFCGCSYCQRGNIKSRRIRLVYEQNAL